MSNQCLPAVQDVATVVMTLAAAVATARSQDRPYYLVWIMRSGPVTLTGPFSFLYHSQATRHTSTLTLQSGANVQVERLDQASLPALHGNRAHHCVVRTQVQWSDMQFATQL